eukprot:6194785-Pleurochrysis_carterae.AAC.1
MLAGEETSRRSRRTEAGTFMQVGKHKQPPGTRVALGVRRMERKLAEAHVEIQVDRAHDVLVVAQVVHDLVCVVDHVQREDDHASQRIKLRGTRDEQMLDKHRRTSHATEDNNGVALESASQPATKQASSRRSNVCRPGSR